VYLSEPNKTKVSVEGETEDLKFVASGMQGWRINMEDAHCAITKFGGDPSCALFGVFDGHGGIHRIKSFLGREVAVFVSRHLPAELLKSPEYISGNYEKALTQTFLKIDTLLESEGGKQEIRDLFKETNAASMETPSKRGFGGLTDEGPDMKGCTCNVILVKNKTLYVANAGDSRSILCKNGKVVELSFDHKPDNEKEKTRINKAGGSVIEGRVDGNLNLSRALGDLRYKKDKNLKPEEQMISGEPEVYKYPITPDFDYVIMGCDGVYETQSNQQIIDFFCKEFKATSGNSLKPAVEKYLDSNCSPDYVKTEGAGCDNMTCIAIKFKQGK
jgi:serine/threonine protein phosphatase PrpC